MDHDDLANYIRRQVQGRKVTSATIKGIVAKHGATRTSEIPVAELADVKAEIDAAGADPAEAERVKADHVQRMGGRKATTKEEDIAAAAAAEPERLKRLAEHLEKYPRPMTDFIAAGELIREQFALATKADKIIATLKTRIKDTRDKMIPLAAAQGASARVKAGKLLLKLRADFDAWLVECATVGRAPFPGNLKANTWPEFVAHYAERSERDCRRCMALARAADPEAAAEAEKKKNARASQ
ncbi:MAG TPA: hypothetical protein VN802_07825, partial [Stellaceae bacterium]|nr:hypothetical protein [Stellaceae bacterium]